jgi:hypothetical protein
MNIQQAFKSGVPFRRVGWPDEDIWFVVENYDDLVAVAENDESNFLEVNIDDICADDWETKE